MFKKAVKERLFLRLALCGVAGSGKTYTALRLACALGARVAVLDSERGSARLYADLFNFDSVEPESFAPAEYVKVIAAAAAGKYDVLVIDSLSHAWMGKDGALEQVDRAASKGGRGDDNKFTAWRNVTPQHNAMVDAILAAPLHIVATMRTHADYVMEEYTKTNGNKGSKPVKVGMKSIQREGLDYEFTIVGDLDLDHNMTISKTRCAALDGKLFHKPGEDFAAVVVDWLNSGAPQTAQTTTTTPIAAQATPPPTPAPTAPAPSQGYEWGSGGVAPEKVERLRANTKALYRGVDAPAIDVWRSRAFRELAKKPAGTVVAEFPVDVLDVLIEASERALKASNIARPGPTPAELALELDAAAEELLGGDTRQFARQFKAVILAGQATVEQIRDYLDNHTDGRRTLADCTDAELVKCTKWLAESSKKAVA